jgi:hydrogenase maturation protease
MAKLTVLGIGNILMRDEGVGVRLLEALQADRAWSDDVEFIDGGVGGLSLMTIIEQARRLIVLDAAEMGLDAGQARVIEPSQVEQAPSEGMLSLHQLPFIQTLQLCAEHFAAPDLVRILAIQPALIESGLTLSPAMQSSMESLKRQAIELIESCLDK